MIYCSMVQQPLVNQGLLNIEGLRSYSHTPPSVGILWTSDQLDAETFTWQYTTPQQTDIRDSTGEQPQTYALDRAATRTTLWLAVLI
jgi:hypothetical protein